MSHACTAKTHRIGQLLAMSDKALRDHLANLANADTLSALHLCYELETAQRQRDYDRPALTRAIAATLRQCANNLALPA